MPLLPIALYNRCIAELVISARNISLVPRDMLAAGWIPVVNDVAHNEMVLGDDRVVYVLLTPFDLADALAALGDGPHARRAAEAEKAAASVQETPWTPPGAAFERIGIASSVIRDGSALDEHDVMRPWREIHNDTLRFGGMPAR